jgi:hypothetical protein
MFVECHWQLKIKDDTTHNLRELRPNVEVYNLLLYGQQHVRGRSRLLHELFCLSYVHYYD